MTHDSTHIDLPAPLQRAIAQLYQVFGAYSAPLGLLDVCTACCMRPELELEMRRLPLRELSTKHFYQYNDAAKSGKQPPDEIKYFLPRLLELLALGEDLHHSTEITLQRLGYCDLSAFSEEERAAIDAYALAFFADGLSQWPNQPNPRFMGDDAFTTLLMFEIGGIAIEPLLAHWLQDASDTATLHFACAVYGNYWESGKMDEQFRDPFAYDREQYQKTMAAWLLAPDNRQVFAQRILHFDHAAAKLATCDSCFFCCTAEENLDTAFDLLTG